MPRINLKAIIICLFIVMISPVLHAQEPEPEKTEEPQPQETGSTLVDMIKSSEEKKGKMHSMDWDTSKYRENMAKEKGEETEEATEETETSAEKNEEPTEDEKVWEHYSSLAERIKAQKAKQKTAKTEKATEEKPEEEKAQEESKEPEEKQSGGIDDILQRYKESQKEQGPMNSRSYGSID